MTESPIAHVTCTVIFGLEDIRYWMPIRQAEQKERTKYERSDTKQIRASQ